MNKEALDLKYAIEKDLLAGKLPLSLCSPTIEEIENLQTKLKSKMISISSQKIANMLTTMPFKPISKIYIPIPSS